MVYKYVCVLACSVDCRTVSHFHFCTWLAARFYHLLACATCGTYKRCHALERNGSLWGIKGIFVKGDYF